MRVCWLSAGLILDFADALSVLSNTFDDKHVIVPSRFLRTAACLMAQTQDHIVRLKLSVTSK